MALLALAQGCLSEEALRQLSTAGSPSASATIGLGGGVLGVPGFTLRVPRGALPGPLDFTITSEVVGEGTTAFSRQGRVFISRPGGGELPVLSRPLVVAFQTAGARPEDARLYWRYGLERTGLQPLSGRAVAEGSVVVELGRLALEMSGFVGSVTSPPRAVQNRAVVWLEGAPRLVVGGAALEGSTPGRRGVRFYGRDEGPVPQLAELAVTFDDSSQVRLGTFPLASVPGAPEVVAGLAGVPGAPRAQYALCEACTPPGTMTVEAWAPAEAAVVLEGAVLECRSGCEAWPAALYLERARMVAP